MLTGCGQPKTFPLRFILFAIFTHSLSPLSLPHLSLSPSLSLPSLSFSLSPPSSLSLPLSHSPSLPLALNLSSSDCSRVGSLFANEEWKKVGSWRKVHCLRATQSCRPCSWRRRHIYRHDIAALALGERKLLPTYVWNTSHIAIHIIQHTCWTSDQTFRLSSSSSIP